MPPNGMQPLAGILIGFKSEDDWFEYRLQSDPAPEHVVSVVQGR